MGRGLPVSKEEAARRAVVARNVRVAANLAGFTITGLADDCGISYSTIGRRLAGETDFMFSEICKIADACHVQHGALLEGSY